MLHIQSHLDHCYSYPKLSKTWEILCNYVITEIVTTQDC